MPRARQKTFSAPCKVQVRLQTIKDKPRVVSMPKPDQHFVQIGLVYEGHGTVIVRETIFEDRQEAERSYNFLLETFERWGE